MASTSIAERNVRVAGVPTRVLESEGDGVPTVFWHGVPDSATGWRPFMEALSGPAYAADMPGFGKSARPDAALFDGSFRAQVDWANRLVDQLGLERYSLVAHDWGTIGLLAATRHPERVHRVVCMNIVPPEGSYQWHWVARLWRRRGLGEASTALSRRVRPLASISFRQARPRFRAMPADFVDECLSNWDAGMTKAIMRLYRSADPPALGAAGEALSGIRAPAKVIWGRADPYIPSSYARWLATALGAGEPVVLDDAGHWPWIDRPDVIRDTARFLEG